MPTPTRPGTPKERLVDLLLAAEGEGGLDAFIARRRADGVSWRLLAIEVTDLTGEDVVPQTLISWVS